MKKLSLLALVLSTSLSFGQSFKPDNTPAQPGQAVDQPQREGTLTLSQSIDPYTIDTGGVACWNNVTFEYRDNAFARTYNLATDFGISGDFMINAVEWGQGTGDDGKVLTISIYIVDSELLSVANFELVNMVTHTISSDDNMTLITTPINAGIPAGSIVAVEVFAPDEGPVPEIRFFPGFNLAGQNSTAWIKSDGTGTGGQYEGCGIPWTDSNTIVVDPQEYVINIVGEETTLGVTDYLAQLIKVYPNPVAERVQIDIPSHIAVQEIGLYNIRGALIDLPVVSGSMDLTNLQAGFYLLKVETPYGTSTKRIIKK